MGIPTRPSNVRVCQFRHFRMAFVGVFSVRVFALPTGDIIAHPFPFVNRIFKNFCENRKKSDTREKTAVCAVAA